jgi:type I restriction enzyme S subunit
MVPKGWSKHKLSEIVVKTQLGTTERHKGNICSEPVPLLKMGNLNWGGFNLRSLEVLPREKLDKSLLLKKGDFLFNTRNTPELVGKSAVWNGELTEAIFDNNINRISFNENIDPFYIGAYLNNGKGKAKINSLPAGSTSVAAIYWKDLKNIQITLPPHPEQRKIAKILFTWDKAISTTERLIDNSKQQKKALMQQLLTGKKRLLDDSGKVFEGEWDDRYLHDVAQIIVSPVDKKTIEGEIPVELCNYTDVYYNTRITQSLNFMKATAKKAEIDKYTLQVNDVVVTKDSETPGDIAVPALVSEDLNGVVCGYHLAIIRPKNELVEGAFLNYLFSMPKTRYYFFTLATGATRFGLSVGGINKAHFTLPPLVEQQKIATVLTNADQEIELLGRQLADLKQEKKALMQQLLTGKRRVKLDDKEVA